MLNLTRNSNSEAAGSSVFFFVTSAPSSFSKETSGEANWYEDETVQRK